MRWRFKTLQRFYRVLVVLTPLLSLAAALAHYAPANLPEGWRTVVTWDGVGGWPTPEMEESTGWNIAVIAFGVVMLTVQVGMFCFQAWARLAFLVITLVFIGFSPFSGIGVSLPLEGALSGWSDTAHDMVLALAYFSPLRHKFTGGALPDQALRL